MTENLGLKRLALEDTTGFGVYARLRSQGLSHEDILAKASQESRYGFNPGIMKREGKLYEYLIGGDPHALKVGSKLWSDAQIILARGKLISDELQKLEIDRLLKQMSSQGSIFSPEQNAETAVRTGKSLLRGFPSYSGLYAFTFLNYLQENSTPMLLKVGRSVNVKERLAKHITDVKTQRPEPLVALRGYETKPGDEIAAEKQLHAVLKVSHRNPYFQAGQTGQEWFQVSLEKLDSYAAQNSLIISRHVVKP